MTATVPVPPGAARSLGPGDPMPRLVLPDTAGGRVDLQHQTVAGDTLVLWLANGVPSADRLAAFAALAADLAEVEARAFLVAPKPLPEGADTAVPILLDPEARLLKSLGLAGPGLLVADPRGRVAAVVEGDAFDEALAQVRAIHAATPPVIRRTGAPALIVPDVVEPALREALLAYWQAGEKRQDMVSSSAEAHAAQAVMKKRSDVILQDKALFARLRDRLLARLVPEMRRAYGFEAASFEALRIGCYDAGSGGFFRRHRDNATPYTAHRRFAMSLNLNTGEYEGGQLRFPEFGRELYEAEAGGAVVFSCSLLHEALPVTKGRRFAVFTFFTDAAGAAREREMAERQAAAGKAGVRVG